MARQHGTVRVVMKKRIFGPHFFALACLIPRTPATLSLTFTSQLLHRTRTLTSDKALRNFLTRRKPAPTAGPSSVAVTACHVGDDGIVIRLVFASFPFCDSVSVDIGDHNHECHSPASPARAITVTRLVQEHRSRRIVSPPERLHILITDVHPFPQYRDRCACQKSYAPTRCTPDVAATTSASHSASVPNEEVQPRSKG